MSVRISCHLQPQGIEVREQRVVVGTVIIEWELVAHVSHKLVATPSLPGPTLNWNWYEC